MFVDGSQKQKRFSLIQTRRVLHNLTLSEKGRWMFHLVYSRSSYSYLLRIWSMSQSWISIILIFIWQGKKFFFKKIQRNIVICKLSICNNEELVLKSFEIKNKKYTFIVSTQHALPMENNIILRIHVSPIKSKSYRLINELT